MTDRTTSHPTWDRDAIALNREQIQDTFQSFPSAVVAIGTMVDEEPLIMIATSFAVGTSFDPPMCMFAVQNSSTTWPALSSGVKLGISILGTGHRDTIYQLASRKQKSRLDGIAWTTLPSGAVTLEESPVWLECSIADQIPAGDHHVILLNLHASSVATDHEPLIHHRATFGRYQQHT